MGNFTVKANRANVYSSFVSVALGSFMAVSGLSAQDALDVQRSETTRRKELSKEAEKLVVIGDSAYEAGSYGDAVDSYKRAMGLLPKAPVVQNYYEAVKDRYAKAAVEYSKQLNREGKFEQGQRLLDDLLRDEDHRKDPLVVAADRQHNDPIRNNPSVTPQHTANVDKVRRLLFKANGAYDLGDFDLANKHYDAVLRIDKTNVAARRGQQKVHQERAAYGRAAYDEARTRILTDVDKNWEIVPVRDFYIGGVAEGEGQLAAPVEVDQRLILSKIMIPSFDVEQTSIANALNRFRILVRENSVIKEDINLVLNLGGELNDAGETIQKLRFDLSVRNIPADKLLDLICKQASTEWMSDQFSISVIPSGQVVDTLLRRSFIVPPNFLDQPIASEGGASGSLFDGGAGVQRKNVSVLDYLKGVGMTFPEGAKASYAVGLNRLTVVNTPQNMRILAEAIQGLKMNQNVIVNVKLRVVDVLQTDLEELGYDWLLAPNALQGGASQLWVGGGSPGNGSAINPIQLGGLPQVTADSLTSGLRSGNGAFPVQGIDARLSQTANLTQLNTADVRAPGVLQATAFLNDSHVQMIIRGLNQKKGVDRVWNPSVSTMPGQRARLEQVRQFIYPTEYDPPEIPDQVGGDGGATPITPATPTAFEERPVGMVFDVEPVVDPDRRYIKLDLKPEFAEFQGFVDYGSPILMIGNDPVTGLPISSESTPNSILMPVFKRTKVETSVTIADGATVAVGGVTRMEIQQLDDRVPVLNSLPFVGDYFKSNGTKTVKRAVVIFASAELVDPTGKKWRDMRDF